MESEHGTRVGESAIRTLTKQEIDHRIDGLVREIALLSDDPANDVTADDALTPRWLPAAELVRRLRRFIVYN